MLSSELASNPTWPSPVQSFHKLSQMYVEPPVSQQHSSGGRGTRSFQDSKLGISLNSAEGDIISFHGPSATGSYSQQGHHVLDHGNAREGKEPMSREATLMVEEGKEPMSREATLMVEDVNLTPFLRSPCYKFPPVDAVQSMFIPVDNTPTQTSINRGPETNRESIQKGKEPATKEIGPLEVMQTLVKKNKAPALVPRLSEFTPTRRLYNTQLCGTPQSPVPINVGRLQPSQERIRSTNVGGGGVGRSRSSTPRGNYRSRGETHPGNRREGKERMMHGMNFLNKESCPALASSFSMLPPPGTLQPMVSLGACKPTLWETDLDPLGASLAGHGQGSGGASGRAGGTRSSLDSTATNYSQSFGGKTATPESTLSSIGTSKHVTVKESRTQASLARKGGGKRKRSRNIMLPRHLPFSDIYRESTGSFNPFTHFLVPGEDIVDHLISIFSQLRDLSASVLSALGNVSTVNIRDPAKPSGVSVFKGQFMLMRVTAATTLRESSIPPEKVTVITVLVRDEYGKFFGGQAAGPLIAASPVIVNLM